MFPSTKSSGVDQNATRPLRRPSAPGHLGRRNGREDRTFKATRLIGFVIDDRQRVCSRKVNSGLGSDAQGFWYYTSVEDSTGFDLPEGNDLRGLFEPVDVKRENFVIEGMSGRVKWFTPSVTVSI
jgi:hypothetical protein